MKKLLSVALIACSIEILCGQAFERRIVIEKGNYYYATVDEQFQIATLHTGRDTTALNASKKLALPAGRNYNDPINPFSWDVSGLNLFAVNFLLHPMNDRNEAIKEIALSSLKEWDAATRVADLVMASADVPVLAYNDPYRFVTARSNILTNFFFDGIVLPDGSYWMAISNNNELSCWKYDGIGWRHGEVFNLTVEGYFSLCAQGQDLYLVLNNGIVKKITADLAIADSDRKLPLALQEGLLITDKDLGHIYFLSNDMLNPRIPLRELITKKAIKLF